MTKYLVCEICDQVAAAFDPERVSLPLTGEMFQAADPELQPPFFPGAKWHEFRCPWGGDHSPFLMPDVDSVEEFSGLIFPKELKTEDGYIAIAYKDVLPGTNNDQPEETKTVEIEPVFKHSFLNYHTFTNLSLYWGSFYFFKYI